MGYKWKPISDLPEDLTPFRDRELESLHQVWLAEQNRMAEAGLESEFGNQLKREWAIETGIIEGVYTLERGITQTLIERGIESTRIPHDSTNRDPELVARIIQDHSEALDGLFAFVKGERELGTSYIKELHQTLLRNRNSVTVFDSEGHGFETELQKGAYKTLPNNPRRPDGSMHEYCPPEHVAAEMDRLIEMYRKHAEMGHPAHVEAAWIHHAFTQIHPFQDGNGRVARSLATLILIKEHLFPLVVNRDDRERYIDALEAADEGDLQPLVTLVGLLQKRALTNAISRAMDAKPVKSVDEALALTRDLLVNIGKIIPAEFNGAKKTATSLCALAQTKLGEMVATLTRDITQVDPTFAFQQATYGAPPNDELRGLAAKLQYDPNATVYHQGIMLILGDGKVASRIVISFHGVGPAFRGLLAAAAYFQYGFDGPAEPLIDDVFRITYQEPLPEATARFAPWLEAALIKGLAAWRHTLV